MRKDHAATVDGMKLVVKPLSPIDNLINGSRVMAMFAPILGGIEMKKVSSDGIGEADVKLTTLREVLMLLHGGEIRWFIENYLADATLDGIAFKAAIEEKAPSEFTLPLCMFEAVKGNYPRTFEKLSGLAATATALVKAAVAGKGKDEAKEETTTQASPSAA